MLPPPPRPNEPHRQGRNHAPCAEEFLRLPPACTHQKRSGALRVGVSPPARSQTGGGSSSALLSRVSRRAASPSDSVLENQATAALRLMPWTEAVADESGNRHFSTRWFCGWSGERTDTINTLFASHRCATSPRPRETGRWKRFSIRWPAGWPCGSSGRRTDTINTLFLRATAAPHRRG